jgi:hypothetical protein
MHPQQPELCLAHHPCLSNVCEYIELQISLRLQGVKYCIPGSCGIIGFLKACFLDIETWFIKGIGLKGELVNPSKSKNVFE